MAGALFRGFDPLRFRAASRRVLGLGLDIKKGNTTATVCRAVGARRRKVFECRTRGSNVRDAIDEALHRLRLRDARPSR